MKVPKLFLKNNPERSLAILLGVIILSLGLVFITLAWTEPTSGPPDGNVSAPINVSNSGQAKEGKLGIQTDLSGQGYDSGYALSVGDSGSVNDGIKVSGPIHLDSSDGNNNITGVNKITVNEVDPVYKIGEKKYATYMADYVGQKVEVVGQSKLNGKQRIINFKNQEKGSDLWLFWKTVSKESVIPFVTAQEQAELYAKVEGSKFIIKSASNNNVPFSYRLVGTRIDADKDGNLYEDQSIKNYIDINKIKE